MNEANDTLDIANNTKTKAKTNADNAKGLLKVATTAETAAKNITTAANKARASVETYVNTTNAAATSVKKHVTATNAAATSVETLAKETTKIKKNVSIDVSNTLVDVSTATKTLIAAKKIAVSALLIAKIILGDVKNLPHAINNFKDLQDWIKLNVPAYTTYNERNQDKIWFAATDAAYMTIASYDTGPLSGKIIFEMTIVPKTNKDPDVVLLMGMDDASVSFYYVDPRDSINSKMKNTIGTSPNVNIKDISSNASVIIHLPTSNKYKILEIPLLSAGKLDYTSTTRKTTKSYWKFQLDIKNSGGNPILAILRVNW